MTRARVYAAVDDMPRAEKSADPRFRDFTGKTFDRLTVLHFAGWEGKDKKNSRWACRCSCEAGNLVVVRTAHLVSKETRSCGCLANETSAECNSTHGFVRGGLRHYLYYTYTSIVERCSKPYMASYPNYGGRGIKCQFNTVEEFAGYVLSTLGERPEGCSLDRIDNNGDYEPGNLRWAKPIIQQRNKQNNHIVSYKGKLISLAELAELAGANYYTIWSRIVSRGWTPEEALHTPIGQKRAKPPTEQPAGANP